jgi:hypothetical protein
LIKQYLLANLVRRAFSHPFPLHQATTVEITRTELVPAYLIKYDLNQTFSTTVGSIRSLRVVDSYLLVNGQNGNLLDEKFEKMTIESSMSDVYYPDAFKNVVSNSFKIGYSTAKRKGTKHIQSRHTKEVGYYGANNVFYRKICEPSVSNILVKSFTQVYIPILIVNFQTLTKKRKLTMCGNENSVEVVRGEIENCELCHEKLGEERLLCNSCGSLVHAPRWLGHSYSCENCRKTICKRCTFWTRKYLILKKKLCGDCAEKLRREGKKIRKMELY